METKYKKETSITSKDFEMTEVLSSADITELLRSPPDLKTRLPWLLAQEIKSATEINAHLNLEDFLGKTFKEEFERRINNLQERPPKPTLPSPSKMVEIRAERRKEKSLRKVKEMSKRVNRMLKFEDAKGDNDRSLSNSFHKNIQNELEKVALMRSICNKSSQRCSTSTVAKKFNTMEMTPKRNSLPQINEKKKQIVFKTQRKSLQGENVSAKNDNICNPSLTNNFEEHCIETKCNKKFREDVNVVNFIRNEDEAYQEDASNWETKGKFVDNKNFDEKTGLHILSTRWRNLQRDNIWRCSTPVNKHVLDTSSNISFTPLQELEIVSPKDIMYVSSTANCEQVE